MKTAMQQAIAYLKDRDLLSAACILEDRFLNIEREQIILAVDKTKYDRRGHQLFGNEIKIKNGEQYYTDTYEDESEDEFKHVRNEALFLRWFTKHYSTATIEGMFGWVDSMGREVTIQEIMREWKKLKCS